MDGSRDQAVTVDGQPYEIRVKFGLFRVAVYVDGEWHAVKSKNQFVRMIDEDLPMGDKGIRIAVVGNSADVAVDGVYLRSGESCVPMSLTPVRAMIMIPVLMATDLLLFGILGFASGLLAGVFALCQSLLISGKSRLSLRGAIYAATFVI